MNYIEIQEETNELNETVEDQTKEKQVETEKEEIVELINHEEEKNRRNQL